MLTVLFAALFALIVGLILCFVGYRAFLVLLPIFGFFAGFWLGAEVTGLIFGAGFLATVTGWVIGFIVGLVGALLSYLFYTVGVALVAAGFGAALGSGFMQAFGFDPGFLVAAVALSSAVMMALLTLILNLQKYVIIAITVIGGANAIVLSALLLLGRVSLGSVRTAGNAIEPILQDSWFWLIIWLAVAVAGFIFQVASNRRYTFSQSQYVEGWG